MSTAGTAERRGQLSEEYGARLVTDSNRYATLIDTWGLRGP